MEPFVDIATLAPLGEQRDQKVPELVVAQALDGAGEIRRAIVDGVLADIHDVAFVVHGPDPQYDATHAATASCIYMFDLAGKIRLQGVENCTDW